MWDFDYEIKEDTDMKYKKITFNMLKTADQIKKERIDNRKEFTNNLSKYSNIILDIIADKLYHSIEKYTNLTMDSTKVEIPIIAIMNKFNTKSSISITKYMCICIIQNEVIKKLNEKGYRAFISRAGGQDEECLDIIFTGMELKNEY